MVGLISVLVFIAVLLFTLGMLYDIQYRRGHWKLLVRIKKQMGEEIYSQEKNADSSVIRKKFLGIIGPLGERIKPKSEADISHLRKTFLKAGYRREGAIVIFFGMKAFLAILLVAILFIIKISMFKIMPSFNFMFLAVALALIGFYLPNLWLKLKIARRKEKLIKGFPDALDLMVVCVEAGVGLDAAINRVGEEMKFSNKALSEEFRLLSLELRAGKKRAEALRNLALRTDLEDVNNLMTLLIQTEKFGTSIGQALRTYSESMRTKRRQRAEEMAAKLPVKLVFPLVFFIFPSLFIVILGPAAIKMVRIMFPIMAGAR